MKLTISPAMRTRLRYAKRKLKRFLHRARWGRNSYGVPLQRLHARISSLPVLLDLQQGKLPVFLQGRTDEAEFLPAALEIIETPPSPAGRAIAGTIIAFLVIALLWACFGSVDIIATAQGKIVPTGRTKIIQPLETGVVRAIHVQDGQAVKAGDVLIEIDSTISEAERDRLQKEYIDAATGRRAAESCA